MAQYFDVIIERDKETKQLFASVPALPGCYSYAENMEELLKNIKEAIELHLGVLKRKKHEVQADSVVGLIKVAV